MSKPEIIRRIERSSHLASAVSFASVQFPQLIGRRVIGEADDQFLPIRYRRRIISPQSNPKWFKCFGSAAATGSLPKDWTEIDVFELNADLVEHHRLKRPAERLAYGWHAHGDVDMIGTVPSVELDRFRVKEHPEVLEIGTRLGPDTVQKTIGFYNGAENTFYTPADLVMYWPRLEEIAEVDTRYI